MAGGHVGRVDLVAGGTAVDVAIRRAHIDAYDVLPHTAPRDLQALVDIAAQVCEVQYAAINLLTEDSQHQVATSGVDPAICSIEHSMCAAVLQRPGTVVIPDASADERFARNPFVTGEIDRVRFYASAPLETPSGVIIGRLCVFDQRLREIDPTQEEALELLAARVVDLLELRLKTRQLEESLDALTRTRDALERSNEALDRFAGQVSHDLLNPLTAVILSTELLSKKPVVAADPTLLRIASNATDAARRLCDMVQDVLRFARVGSVLHLKDVDLDDLARAALVDLDATREATDARVELGALGTVHADERQLYAVLLNLISNAMKFARPGVPPEVSVTREDVAGAVRILVSDNGIGIPESARADVFRLFTRGADVERVAGEGIGLATVRRIIESHGGTVHVEGRDGPGTVLVVTLPTIEAPDDPEPSAP